MLLSEYLDKNPRFDMEVLATDISTKVLEQAKKGVYPAARLEKIPTFVVKKYFHRGYGGQEGYFRIKPSLRKMVQFTRLNLMESFPFKEPFNVIFCRNVMIYFDKATQEVLANKLYDWLFDGGYLFIGHSETLTLVSHPFRYIRPSVYQKL